MPMTACSNIFISVCPLRSAEMEDLKLLGKSLKKWEEESGFDATVDEVDLDSLTAGELPDPQAIATEDMLKSLAKKYPDKLGDLANVTAAEIARGDKEETKRAATIAVNLSVHHIKDAACQLKEIECRLNELRDSLHRLLHLKAIERKLDCIFILVDEAGFRFVSELVLEV